ncbi:glycosyltransferase family 2 protein [bacterium]|nr:glycosyltransferase family 2 protein [bacterium]
MFVSGFTFIRNAIKLDYPVEQAIRSVLPLVDEMCVAVGKSDDDTRALVASIDPKIRILDTIWDDSLRTGGVVLAKETDKAFNMVSEQADWCIYIQADECLHEAEYPQIRNSMEVYLDDSRVEGFLFKYRHFYGSYDYIGDSRSWYKNEVRIIRNDPEIHSWKDAQGFRKNGQKLNVIGLDAHVHHYGWVRHPSFQMAKQKEAFKLWHSDEFIEKKFSADEFDYSEVDSVELYKGTHPAVMQERINSMNWEFETDPSKKNMGFKKKVLYWLDKKLGLRPWEHRNYSLIKAKSPASD